MSELLTLLEASRLLGVDSADVIRMIYRDEIEGVVVEGQLMVPVDQGRTRPCTRSRIRTAPVVRDRKPPDAPALP